MYKFLKVVFDVLLALIALACVSWLLLPCMLILWCTGEHKVWYLQKRAERQYSRIIPGCQAACPHIGGVLQHGGELKNRKHPVPVPNPFLQIP